MQKGDPADDVEANERAPRIKFQPSERHSRHDDRSRSASRELHRDSISSIRSRVQSTSGFPIEHRTLSFQVSHSQAQAAARGVEVESKEREEEDHKYFARLAYHTLNTDEVCQRLNVLPLQGLSESVAVQRLQRDGKNTIPTRRENYLKKLFWYVFGGFCSVLWVGAIVFFLCWRPLGNPPQAYNLGLAILVLIVIFLQACFSAFQDWSTKRTMESILDLLPSEALTLRDGQLRKIPATELVEGDIVRIAIGNKVPADIRLLNTSGDLRFDRSVLTGESDEIEGAVNATDDNFLETRNIALMGTMVTNGNGSGVVVLTGGRTVMGRIAKASSGVKDQPTLIQREINRFVSIIVCLTVCLASLILFTWIGWLRVDHYAFMNVAAMLDDVMGCVVAFIPEGMPVGVALTLLMIARRMKAADILPKGLSTVETLGCVNVICSDKTGTLTENRMVVTTVGFIDQKLTADEAISALAHPEGTEALQRLHKASVLCNDASFDPLSLDRAIMDREVQGNATDGAVLKFAEAAKANHPVDTDDRRIFEIPFNSKNKWMLTMHQDHESTTTEKPRYLLFLKGAPDVLLPRCADYWSYQKHAVLPLDAEATSQLTTLQAELSRNAERVVLLCEGYYTPSAVIGSNYFGDEIIREGMDHLTIIGVLGITDPPRTETAATVAACQRAGVRFFMVTGDFGLTGAAIARNVGIFSGTADPDTYEAIQHGATEDTTDLERNTHSNRCPPQRSNTSLLLEGSQISKLTSQEWAKVCAYREVVFARTTPEQKLRIVNELKRCGNAVAVTGDGVNDAPALRAADVGIAVVSGSDVALEAADLVLLDKFDSIVEAIRLGRLVFQNLQKVIAYLLPAGSWSEIWPVLMNVYFGVPLPLVLLDDHYLCFHRFVPQLKYGDGKGRIRPSLAATSQPSEGPSDHHEAVYTVLPLYWRHGNGLRA